MSNKAPAEKRDNLMDYAWGKIVVGLILGIAVFYLHNLFTDLETGVIQSARLNVIIIFLYKTLGHIPTIAVLGILGVACLILGVRQLIMKRQ